MNRSPFRLSLMWPLLIALILSESTALAQHEVPSIYPGVWYRIAFDNEGNRTIGDGDGYSGQWYYYPTSDCYRMWFYNDPYDPDRKGYLKYEAYIKPVDPTYSTYAAIRFNWATPEWSAQGHSRPPLPGDISSASEEDAYMSGAHMYIVDNLRNFESIEPTKSYTISGYNPEWISIDIKGRNARIYRGAWHECREKNASDPGDEGSTMHVCCRWSSGDCYTIFGGRCAEGYEDLGPNASCSDCVRGGAPTLDFGDAPDPGYPTTLTSNGARHTIDSALYLGKSITAEADALANATASGDADDGVTITSALQPGWPTSVEVTASTQGYLNAWIDFNGDGDFADADEQIFVDALLSTGTNELSFEVPGNASAGATFARFRFNSRGLLSYDGLASDGEVEDYTVEISQNYEPYQTSGVTSLKWSQPPSTVDRANPYLFEGITTLSTLDLHQVAADDFQFEAGQPVTGIHWWGSFNGWTDSYLPPVLPLAFHIAIWTDVEVSDRDNTEAFGHPGTLVWESYCTQWAWNLAGYQAGNKDESLGETCFQFSYLLSQNEWFQPTVDADGKNGDTAFYWISIAAVYDSADELSSYSWGWLTRDQELGAAATLIQEITPEPWPPSAGVTWASGLTLADSTTVGDLAFQLTTYGGEGATSQAKGKAPNSETGFDLDDLAWVADRWLSEMP